MEKKSSEIQSHQSINLVPSDFLEIEEHIEELIEESVESPEKREDLKKSILLIISKVRSSPFPDSDQISGYYNIDKSFGDRILLYIENEQNHRHNANNYAQETERILQKDNTIIVEKEVEADAKDTRLGQIFAFIIAMTSLIGGFYLILIDKQISGTIFSGIGVALLVSKFIMGRKGLINNHINNNDTQSE